MEIIQLSLFDEIDNKCPSSSAMSTEVKETKITKEKNIIVSPMNYTGGKKKLLSRIKEKLPVNIETFVDLFCGGCTVGINSDAQKVIFNDAVKPMIEMYSSFQSHSAEDVIKHIEQQIARYGLSLTNKEGYEHLRDDYNKYQEPLDLFVLVCYCFNHMIRFNSDGKFNTSFGADRSQFNPVIKKNLTTFIDELKLKNTEFTNFDFRNFPFDNLTKNDFVYCDPPYFVSLAAYNSTWGEKEERDLLKILTELDKRDIKFALSNVMENKREVNEILKEWVETNKYNVFHFDMSYANSSYHRKDRNDKSDEVLITNY